MKAAIIIDPSLPLPFQLNASACITSGLFNEQQDCLGIEIEGDHEQFIPITKIPILILQHNKPWKELIKRAKKRKLKHMIFTEEAQSTSNYDEYVERVKGKSQEGVNIIGLGVIGNDEDMDRFSGDIPLLREE